MKDYTTCDCGHRKVQDIICDICGQTCQTDCGTIIDGKSYEFAELKSVWGYATAFDQEQHTLDICSTCYSWMPEPWRSKVVRKECAAFAGFTGRQTIGLDSNNWDNEETA